MCVKYFKLDFRYICLCACITWNISEKTEKVADYCLEGEVDDYRLEGDLLCTEYSLLPV